MKTENKDGKTLRYTNAGETAITAGSIVYVCGRMGIAKAAIPAGATGIIDMTGGVFKFSPTVSGNKAQGVAVYLPEGKSSDDGTGLLFTAGADTKLAGHLDEAADSGAEEVSVRLAEESAGISAAAAIAGAAAGTTAGAAAIAADLADAESTIKAAAAALIAGAGNVRLVTAPAAADSTGVKGDVAIDETSIYLCTAANTWVKAALAFATWA